MCSGEEDVLIVMSADAISVAHYWLTYMTNIPAVCWNVTHLSSIFRCLNFARIFTEMSESFTEPIVQFPNRVSSYNIVTRCSDWNKYTFIKERNQACQLINRKWSSWDGHCSCATIEACGWLCNLGLGLSQMCLSSHVENVPHSHWSFVGLNVNK